MSPSRTRHAAPGRGWIAIVAALIAGTSGPWAKSDEVALVPGAAIKQAIGGKVRGQVVSETPGEVVIQVGGASVKVAVDQIASIRYDGQPAAIELAASREGGGLLTEAAEFYRKAAADAANRPLILQSILFREADVLAELSQVDPKAIPQAREKLETFIRAYPNGRHIGPARASLSRLFLQTGDFAAASREIDLLGKLPGMQDRAAVLQTSVLTRQGKHEEAVVELDRLIAKFPKNSVDQRSAQLAKAENLAALKRYDIAESLVREIIQANPPENAAVQAPAYNTLGDCMREANRPKDALIAYLHTDLLYAKNKEEHPRALFQISHLFRKLKQDSRADEVWRRLKQEYPRSPWLNASVGGESPR